MTTTEELRNWLWRRRAAEAQLDAIRRRMVVASTRTQTEQSEVQPKVKRERRTLMPWEVKKLAEKHPGYADVLWLLFTTGIRSHEFEKGLLSILPGKHVMIRSEKQYNVRYLPLVDVVGTNWRMSRSWYRELRQELGPVVMSARSTALDWMYEAGIPTARIRGYVGHGKQEVTEAHVKEDGQKLNDYIARHCLNPKERRAALMGNTNDDAVKRSIAQSVER